MIDLNHFIPSVDFLTAVSQRLKDVQRGTVTSCCFILPSWQQANEHWGKHLHKDARTHSFCRPSDYVQAVVCWFDIHALWRYEKENETAFRSKSNTVKQWKAPRAASMWNCCIFKNMNLGLSPLFFYFFFKQSKSPRPRFHFSNTHSTFWIDVR